jgi:hypothetical protein
MDLAITRGEHVVYTITLTESGAAVDLTGVTTMRWTMRTNYPASSVISDADATLSKTIGSGLTVTNPTSGVVELEIVKADTNLLPIGIYVFGLKYLPLGETEPRVIVQGNVILSADVVRGL